MNTPQLPPQPLSILIVDDHPLVRDGLRALLNSLPDMEVVGEASNGLQAVEQALQHKPAVILMDLHMPELSGAEAIRRIMAAQPQTGILALTMLEDDASVFSAMQAGARGYLLKGATQEEVLRAIKAIAAGEAIFSPKVATRLVQYFNTMRPTLPSTAFPELTEREREILTLISVGKSNADIAAAFEVSLKTVSNHVSNIYSKLQVTDRSQAMLRAREAGFGPGNH